MEKKTLNIKVDINFDKNRIDKFLHSNLSQFSRSTLKRLINEGVRYEVSILWSFRYSC